MGVIELDRGLQRGKVLRKARESRKEWECLGRKGGLRDREGRGEFLSINYASITLEEYRRKE